MFYIGACAAQIKEAVLNGVSLEDDKREQFNKIEQVCFKWKLLMPMRDKLKDILLCLMPCIRIYSAVNFYFKFLVGLYHFIESASYDSNKHLGWLCLPLQNLMHFLLCVEDSHSISMKSYLIFFILSRSYRPTNNHLYIEPWWGWPPESCFPCLELYDLQLLSSLHFSFFLPIWWF